MRREVEHAMAQHLRDLAEHKPKEVVTDVALAMIAAGVRVLVELAPRSRSGSELEAQLIRTIRENTPPDRPLFPVFN